MTAPVSNNPKRSAYNRSKSLDTDSIKNLFTGEQLDVWSVKLENLIRDTDGRELFLQFLEEEYSEENLLFWTEVESLRNLVADPDEYMRKTRCIYSNYVKINSNDEINIAGHTRRKIDESIKDLIFSENIFDEAQEEVYKMMNIQSYPRFLVSDIFKQLQESALLNQTASTNPPPNVHACGKWNESMEASAVPIGIGKKLFHQDKILTYCSERKLFLGISYLILQEIFYRKMIRRDISTVLHFLLVAQRF